MKSVTYTIARPDTGAVLPQAVVTVYQADGTTRASLFNAGGVAIGNPLTADSNGAVSFAAANGTYLLSATSADGALTLPNISVQVFDLDALATAIAAGSLAGVIGVKFATQALRDADLAHAAGTIALTYADSDPLKNDLSYKIGSSGSGSWSAPLGLMAGLSYTYAQQAFNAVAAATQVFDHFQQRAAGILEGGFFAARDTRVDTAVDTFYSEICGFGDDGSVDVTAVNDGYPIYGPVTVSTAGGAENQTISLTLPAGAKPSFFYSNVTGTVTAIYSKLEGLPA